jgi:erythromycin esterase-like protein
MSLTNDVAQTIEAVRAAARPLLGQPGDHDPLLELVGDARFVLLGEASHGTHEFYRERARITARLIAEKGFDAVAIEGDWPDAYRVNRFVRQLGDDPFAIDALAGFRRFPTWMWRNTDVVDFLDWQRGFNATRAPAARTGFYGLDLYSLNGSMEAVLRYLEQADPAAAQRARERYACFDRFDEGTQVYGLMVGLGTAESCERQVIEMLVELRRRAAEATRVSSADGSDDDDDAFNAEQNARLVKNAEQYYRTMYLSDVSSWNLRDRHMVETLGALERHLGRQRGRPAKIVVWAHNSHLGDARATEMGQRRGELNVGQLVREQHGREALLVGFTTAHGSVTAASDWGGPAERKRVMPARPDSYEAVLQATGLQRFMLPLRDAGAHTRALHAPRLERAIGVIYRPETERQSHYFQARLAEQFDALLHFDETRAAEPLERNAEWQGAEAPETYPSGV